MFGVGVQSSQNQNGLACSSSIFQLIFIFSSEMESGNLALHAKKKIQLFLKFHQCSAELKEETLFTLAIFWSSSTVSTRTYSSRCLFCLTPTYFLISIIGPKFTCRKFLTVFLTTFCIIDFFHDINVVYIFILSSLKTWIFICNLKQ